VADPYVASLAAIHDLFGMKWLNILGMVLQFVSFWCAAPELLGETTLRRLEAGMTRLVARIPVIMVFGGMLVYAGGMGLFGLVEGLRASRGESLLMDQNTYYLFLGFAMVAYALFMVFHARILGWLERRLAQPLVHKLVASADARRNALVLGAVLLTTGFLLQLIVALVV
jgi:hypothetical protein